MSRFRMYPTPAQRAALLEQCKHARYIWNLAVEQWSMWTRDKGPTPGYVKQSEQIRLKHLRRRLTRSSTCSKRRQRVKAAIAKLYARAGDRRKDWTEKTSTDLARRFDVIRVEDLRIARLTRRPKPKPDPEHPGTRLPNRRRAKAGVDGGILLNGWGMLVRRLEDKAPGRVERLNPAYTSQTCAACGHCASGNRESQAVFRRVACSHQANADVNAAVNIAAGRAVSARREMPVRVSLKREPQLATSA